ncbi:hypothetical protein BJX61DRAFT_517679 [Aspergillus egyptiacus]|nr:hypothetical protein BJX61DRAFT_517679 [Aspergillus egyptiacus]
MIPYVVFALSSGLYLSTLSVWLVCNRWLQMACAFHLNWLMRNRLLLFSPSKSRLPYPLSRV